MPQATLAVSADVLDARTYKPTGGETFLVDTNVWKWVSFSKASIPTPAPYQARLYPPFIRAARANGAQLFHCGLALSELANIIERQEFQQYASLRGLALDNRERKAFRRDAAERQKVTAEIAGVWGQVKALSSVSSVVIDEAVTDACLGRLCSCAIDAYDGFLLESATGVTMQILSDDSDMGTVAGIRVFTCNNQLLASAAAAGRLRTF